jgi:TolA-binding protein
MTVQRSNIARILVLFAAGILLSGCSGTVRHKDSIGSLNGRKIELQEPVIEDALEKAMQAYRKFLEEADETEATPEAMRRLADLQLEAGAGTYDFVKEVRQQQSGKTVDRAASANVKQESIAEFGKSSVASPILAGQADTDGSSESVESQQSFEARATQMTKAAPASAAPLSLPGGAPTQEAVVNSNTDEAIQLYKKLLEKYPLYERNDQVMYQLARAYEDGGRQDEAMQVLNELVKKYPTSVHYDEAQFRRGEIFFVRKQYHDAEKAYSEVVRTGPVSAFYDQSLFKRGWSFFKQSLFEEGLDDFVALLDIKTAAGYHIKTEANKTEYQRVDDTFRVVSLSFSYIGGPEFVKNYFDKRGHRDYEDLVYSYLGDHYLEKRRYQDAANAYKSFIALYPLHEKASGYQMRIIEIFRKGQFPQLVIEAKREFAITYDLKSTYWTYHDINRFPEELAFIKTNLTDLAKHYHALSQRSKKREERHAAYLEATRWYRSFLASFPEDEQAPGLNFLLAELFFENKAYQDAAEEYERTAYAYPVHPKSAESGYAAVLAYREYEKQAPEHLQAKVHQESIRSSLQFADTYPKHAQAAAVLTAAAESLYQLKEYDRAIDAAQKMLRDHAQADRKLVTASWIVVAHSTFDLQRYVDSEKAYGQVLQLLPAGDSQTSSFRDKLAASIYQQGDAHVKLGENEAAVEDFLRIAKVAPQSEIRQAAEFDASTVLINLKNWDQAIDVLVNFRRNFPASPRQFEITTKLAYVYQEGGKAGEAAREFERIADDGTDPELKKEALTKAAELYVQADDFPSAIKVYRRFIKAYPDPVEPALEAHNQLAQLYRKTGQPKAYTATLKDIVSIDRRAGAQRSNRTKYLAGLAAIELAEPVVREFKDAPLGEPFQKTLAAKKKKMQSALDLFAQLAEYGVAEVTAAATYHIAGIYYEFSRDLLESEKPKNLSEEELAQYDLLLEEQAYPFEEKAISIHEKNVELLSVGVYNEWVDKSLAELARLFPVRYAKNEQGETFVASIS